MKKDRRRRKDRNHKAKYNGLPYYIVAIISLGILPSLFYTFYIYLQLSRKYAHCEFTFVLLLLTYLFFSRKLNLCKGRGIFQEVLRLAFYANLSSLASRTEDLSYKFFSHIADPASCLHSPQSSPHLDRRLSPQGLDPLKPT